MKRIFLIAVAFWISLPVFSNTVYRDGKVESIKMFGSVVVIYVDTVELACGGNHNRVAIRETDPLFSTAVSTALTAKATGADIEIGYDDQCTKNPLSWDFQSLWLK